MVSTKPASGMRDFLPSAVRARRQAVAKIIEAYERHGFVPLETPTMERLDVLLGKYGDEGDQLVFRVLKRGDRLKEISAETTAAELADLGLRYDLTVPLARVVARHGNELPRWFKRYQIQPVWRADRPQKGRFREFYQCDVDFLGTESIVAEACVLQAVSEALDALDFTGVRLRINDRRILDGFMRNAGIREGVWDLYPKVLRTIDKLDKIGPESVEKELCTLIPREDVPALYPMIRQEFPEDPKEHLRQLAEETFAYDIEAAEACRALITLFELLDASAVDTVTPVYDATLARGLSYYTGPIFEANVDDLSGSIAGGGRYDDLIGMFQKQPVPAVGCSLGLERILTVLEERGALTGSTASADVAIAWMDDDTLGHTHGLATELRKNGLRVEIVPQKLKLGKQLQHAEAIGARFVIIAGKREVEAGEVALKDLVSGDQVKVPRAEIASVLETRLASE